MRDGRARTPARVLLITTHYHPVLGGVETHARHLARALRRRGRRVVVLTTLVDGQPRARIERLDGVAVVRTRPASGRRRFTKWLFVPVAAATAIRLRRHFDVIFVPDLRGVGLAALLAGWWLPRPVVLQGGTPGAFSASHWNESARTLPIRPPGFVVETAKRVLRRLQRRADLAVCITRQHAQEARDAGIAADRIRYIPHGVDMTVFAPPTPDERRAIRRTLGWPDANPIVVFLGRLSREKGVLDLLEAWRHVAIPGARLALVGPDGTGHSLDAGPAARALVAAHGLADSVLFVGPTDAPEAVLRAGDLLVQPSHYEAFPLTVIEAMACGLPVVASFVGGLRDYLVQDENALVCDPQDAPGLAAALTRVLSDPALRGRLGRAGLETVRARFDEARNLAAYEAAFDEVVRRAAPAS
jgi:glycosyltransferase involved in cell wall biosynthesis